MKITVNDTNAKRFGDLYIGDTFIDNQEFDEDTVLMVVDVCIELKLEPDTLITGTDEIYGYAVDLSSGTIYGYKADEMVIPVKSELTVTK
jgi:hypothetical protein